MIGKCAWATWLFLLLACFAKGQSEDSLNLNQLRPPSSPAFNILGIEPESVMRPSTPNALGSALVSSIQDGFLRPDIALEFAPYWLKSRPNISFKDYIAPTFKQRLKQTTAISIATSSFNDENESGSRLGWGVRTQWLSGTTSSRTVELTKATLLETMLGTLVGEYKRDTSIHTPAQLETKVLARIDAMLDGTADLPQLTGLSPKEIKSFLREKAKKQVQMAILQNPKKEDESMKNYINRLRSENALLPKATAKRLSKGSKEPVGWLLQSAIASSMTFPSERFQFSEIPNASAWTTLTYRSYNEKSAINLMVRYTGSFVDSVSNNLDIGLSLVRHSSNFSFALEGLYRAYRVEGVEALDETLTQMTTTTIEGETYRVTMNVAYKLSDLITLNATVGKDYDHPIVVGRNVLTLFGMNFNLPTSQVTRL
ncbi:MAG: hypothetical protein ACFB10_08985 [Salibacteraceae bacterium]